LNRTGEISDSCSELPKLVVDVDLQEFSAINGLHLCEAAIHKQFRACDVAAVGGCEKHHGLRDLIGRTEPAERHTAGKSSSCFPRPLQWNAMGDLLYRPSQLRLTAPRYEDVRAFVHKLLRRGKANAAIACQIVRMTLPKGRPSTK
jgi:hypothetical protein